MNEKSIRSKIEGASCRVLLTLVEKRCTYGGTRYEWSGVGRDGFTIATARKLLQLGLIETRPTSLPGRYLLDARATLSGCVAATEIDAWEKGLR